MFSLIKKLLVVAITLGATNTAFAEVNEVRFAKQFGFIYMPLILMENQNLVQKHAEKLGIKDLKTTFSSLGGGATQTDALWSGSVNFVSAGVPATAILWDKTKGGVRSIGALNAINMYLLTANPDIKSIRDFSAQDRIAVPGAKVSSQAVYIQMAAAKEFGMKNYQQLDRSVVTRAHPDALISLSSGNKEVNSHFSTFPYFEKELALPYVHQVTTSYEITGINHLTPTIVITTKRFADENPKVTKAVVDAFAEAVQFMKDNPKETAQIYIDVTKDKLTVDEIINFMNRDDVKMTVVPRGYMKTAQFLKEAGAVKNMPNNITDVFLTEIPGIEDGN